MSEMEGGWCCAWVPLKIPPNPSFELGLRTSNPGTAWRWHNAVLAICALQQRWPPGKTKLFHFKAEVLAASLTCWELEVLPSLWFKGWWLPLQMFWMWQQKANTFFQLPRLAAELGCNWTRFSAVQMSAGCGLEFTATIYFKGFQSWASGPYLGIEVSAVIFLQHIRSWFKDLGGAVGSCVTSEALILCTSGCRARGICPKSWEESGPMLNAPLSFLHVAN